MGLKEETTGKDCAEDVGSFGEFPTDKEEMEEGAIERALERIEKRGFWGSVYFWLKKDMTADA